MRNLLLFVGFTNVFLDLLPHSDRYVTAPSFAVLKMVIEFPKQFGHAILVLDRGLSKNGAVLEYVRLCVSEVFILRNSANALQARVNLSKNVLKSDLKLFKLWMVLDAFSDTIL